ncbi:hypothetical protein MNB_SV-15-114 [hydrothermal vent metagenome]|uniref:Uncharacterized protein n=1 Tax=hydrothermal vent metagenome TaxID=652676 RepID=A0A1W1EIA1_9ZZZZ
MIDKFNSKKEFYQNLQQSKKIDKKAVVLYLHNKEYIKYKPTKIYYLIEFKYINNKILKFKFDENIINFYKVSKYLIIK